MSEDSDRLSRSAAQQRDADDPLRHARDRFALRDGLVYLDGNSLGAMPRHVSERLTHVVEHEWRHDLIGSWNTAGWLDLPARAGARIARLVGARADEVVAADSTSVNLFKLLVAAARLRPDRRVLVTEPSTFPTDGYIAASVARLCGLRLCWCDPLDPLAAVDEDTAVLALTHVDFRTGRMYDMHQVTDGAHEAGALMLWDLCHSAGALPVDLDGADVDLAVGCTYKYLNAGPGAPAYCFVARRLQEQVDQPLTGWMGHAEPFAMEREYRPAAGIDRMRAGSPPILGLAALDAALDAFDGVGMADLRRKSLALTSLFIDLVRAHTDLEVVTPEQPEQRGSQVSLRHPDAYAVVQALIARDVVGDFRAPDLARFGFAPLYVRYVDVWDAVEALRRVLAGREYADPAYAVRAAVT
ncbi:MAG: kynureninase [Actinomycetota bacterium]|nr:kynureninase [Actinomycetota bacterium]